MTYKFPPRLPMGPRNGEHLVPADALFMFFLHVVGLVYVKRKPRCVVRTVLRRLIIVYLSAVSYVIALADEIRGMWTKNKQCVGPVRWLKREATSWWQECYTICEVAVVLGICILVLAPWAITVFKLSCESGG